jgi:hypothetical protein
MLAATLGSQFNLPSLPSPPPPPPTFVPYVRLPSTQVVTRVTSNAQIFLYIRTK